MKIFNKCLFCVLKCLVSASGQQIIVRLVQGTRIERLTRTCVLSGKTQSKLQQQKTRETETTTFLTSPVGQQKMVNPASAAAQMETST